MFKTNKIKIVRTCQEQLQFRLPSDLVASRSIKEIRIWGIRTIVILLPFVYSEIKIFNSVCLKSYGLRDSGDDCTTKSMLYATYQI